MIIYIIITTLIIISIILVLVTDTLIKKKNILDNAINKRYLETLKASEDLIAEIENRINKKINDIMIRYETLKDTDKEYVDFDVIEAKEGAAKLIEELQKSINETNNSTEPIIDKCLQLEVFNAYGQILLQEVYKGLDDDSSIVS